MASEIRVNKLNSQTGVGTITLSPTGVDISGITTAATLKATTGIVTTLTATTGIVTTLTTNTTRATTGIVTSLEATTGDITTLRAPTGIVTSFVTNTAKVGGGVTISESGIEASGIGITVANINGGQLGGRRNIIINGAMNVAQRGISSTTDGYQTVDRFSVEDGNEDEACTREQAAVTSGGAYNAGFRNCLKITNGNQTGGAGATDYIQIMQRVEAQNMANSGWNFPSSSSFITLSFWVKTSVAQAFSGSLRTADGTAYSYKFDTPVIPPNTWTKVVKTIPGNSNLTFNDDNGDGLSIYLYAYLGTTYTSSNTNTETWITAATDTYSNDMSQNWWTTNDATFEVTGFQLEVGSQATPFEHRSFAEELALCQRYYYGNVGSGLPGFGRVNSQSMMFGIHFPIEMRVNPSMALTVKSNAMTIAEPGESNFYPSQCTITDAHGGKKSKAFYINSTTNNSVTKGDNLFLTDDYLKFDAEL